MEIDRVLGTLAVEFGKHAVRYALMGGYAVAIHGYPRTTVDLDFLVDRSDLPSVDRILGGMGYGIRHRSDDVSQFVSPDDAFGEIDFIHAFRQAARRMLEGAVPHRLAPEGPEVMVLRVEDVIGLKVQAIANNPSRKEHDLADIRALVSVHRSRLDWPLLEEYFSLFGMDEMCAGLKGEAS